MIIAGLCSCENSFSARHAAGLLLRDYMLSELCKIDKCDMKIVIKDGGKPVLFGIDCGFSVSHCKNAVCCFVNSPIAECSPDINYRDAKWLEFGCGTGSEIGADVEILGVRSHKHMRAVAQKKFFEGERAVLNGLQDDEFEKEFLRIWTQKESICKLTGEGISAMGRYDTSSLPYSIRVQTVTAKCGGNNFIISFCVYV